MDYATFWQMNGTPGFETGYTTWSQRYTGSLTDFETYRAQIESFFRRNANHRAQTVLTMWAVEDGDGFIVYGIGR